jgi:hypothetical protein
MKRNTGGLPARQRGTCQRGRRRLSLPRPEVCATFEKNDERALEEVGIWSLVTE